jgi:cbb3-type cytochrome oxidase maturation protein
MDILYLLIPFSVVLVFVIGILFWWSLRHGQFEDLEGPAYRVLMDDDSPNSEGSEADAGQAKDSDKRAAR